MLLSKVFLDVNILLGAVSEFSSLASAQKGLAKSANRQFAFFEGVRRGTIGVELHVSHHVLRTAAQVLAREGWSREDATAWVRYVTHVVKESGGRVDHSDDEAALPAVRTRLFKAGIDSPFDDNKVVVAAKSAAAVLVTADCALREASPNFGLPAVPLGTVLAEAAPSLLPLPHGGGKNDM